MSRLPPITDAQFQAASQWLGRINEQPAQAQSAAFRRWLLADPQHPAAYAQAQSAWHNSGPVAAALAAEDQHALQGYLDAMARPVSRRPWGRRVAGLAAAACLVLALGMAGGWQPGYWIQDLQADYSSAGQVRHVTLPDQSQVTLDAHSAIAVQFAQGHRRVRLLHGAAFFQVTHTGEPFLVDAAGGQVRVLGTQFEVRDQGAGAQVTVRSGRVAVSPAQGAAGRELTANQQVMYASGQVGNTVMVNSDNRLAWREGWLNYSQAPLAQVLDDLRRYYPGRILLLDDALGQRLVSGSFPVAEPMLALDSLGKVVGFERHTVLGRLTLIRP
ncbi:DUF4880 domain-containing protein [Pseudomonas sp. S60]|uniref:FecR family protein n=1 Tax=Pseudomonas sp. S60 TaxID=211124 RepID=UPI001911DF93|nr:FecR domain-containing protein [Pseudomonas sp. S60]MBK5011865.1 DUF4880 domain-containing protein [Pseudomonas sp. S60]